MELIPQRLNGPHLAMWYSVASYQLLGGQLPESFQTQHQMLPAQHFIKLHIREEIAVFLKCQLKF